MTIDILRIVHNSCCAITILADLLIVFIIATRTKDRLRAYSIIVINFAIVEFTAAVGSFLHGIRNLDTAEYLIAAITGPSRFTESRQLCFYIVACTIHCRLHYCVLLAFSFCYRMYVINQAAPTSSKLVSALLLAYTPSAIVYVMFAAAPLLSSEDLLKVMTDAHPEYYYNSIAASELLIVAKKQGFISNGFLLMKYLGVPVYAVIIILPMLFHQSLSSSLKMSDKSKRMHREIMKGLILQSLLAAFFLICTAIYLAREHGLAPEWKQRGQLAPTVMSVQFAASPLITLYFVRPYRLAIKSFFTTQNSLLEQMQTHESEDRNINLTNLREIENV